MASEEHSVCVRVMCTVCVYVLCVLCVCTHYSLCIISHLCKKDDMVSPILLSI